MRLHPSIPGDTPAARQFHGCSSEAGRSLPRIRETQELSAARTDICTLRDAGTSCAPVINIRNNIKARTAPAPTTVSPYSLPHSYACRHRGAQDADLGCAHDSRLLAFLAGLLTLSRTGFLFSTSLATSFCLAGSPPIVIMQL